MRDSRPQIQVSSPQGGRVFWGLQLQMVLPDEAERMDPSVKPADRSVWGNNYLMEVDIRKRLRDISGR